MKPQLDKLLSRSLFASLIFLCAVPSNLTAQNMVLIKNTEPLEKLNKVNALIVDKTGTITEGKPTVEIIGTSSGSFSDKEVLQYIISLNKMSKHPVTEATGAYGKKNGADLLKADRFHAISNKGVEGNENGKKVALGNDKMMEHAKANLAAALKEKAATYQKQGKTVSYLSVDEEVDGYVVIGD